MDDRTARFKDLLTDIDQLVFALKMRLSDFVVRVLEEGNTIDLSGLTVSDGTAGGGIMVSRDSDDGLLYLEYREKPGNRLPWDDLDVTAQYDIVQGIYMAMDAASRYASLSHPTETSH